MKLSKLNSFVLLLSVLSTSCNSFAVQNQLFCRRDLMSDTDEPENKRRKISNDGIGFNTDDNIIEELEENSSTAVPKYGDYSINHFYDEELREKITSRRFKVAVYRKQLLLKNIEDAPKTPDELLHRLIEHLIDEARNDKQKQFGNKPEKFSFVFRSSILDKPIQVCSVMV